VAAQARLAADQGRIAADGEADRLAANWPTSRMRCSLPSSSAKRPSPPRPWPTPCCATRRTLPSPTCRPQMIHRRCGPRQLPVPETNESERPRSRQCDPTAILQVGR
jgi:hypothetical protein